jgi:DNA-binding HxlR family transcriptional regulator
MHFGFRPNGYQAVSLNALPTSSGNVLLVSPESKPSPRVCSVADALSIVGDRYALLVAREIRYGHTRFQDIATSTGAPRDVLTARLRKLEQAGVIERRQYSEHPPRHEYLLTNAGRDLQPILVALKEWGDRYVNPGAEPIIFQHTCGSDFHPVTVCAACKEPLRDGELTVTGGTHPVEATM